MKMLIKKLLAVTGLGLISLSCQGYIASYTSWRMKDRRGGPTVTILGDIHEKNELARAHYDVIYNNLSLKKSLGLKTKLFIESRPFEARLLGDSYRRVLLGEKIKKGYMPLSITLLRGLLLLSDMHDYEWGKISFFAADKREAIDMAPIEFFLNQDFYIPQIYSYILAKTGKKEAERPRALANYDELDHALEAIGIGSLASFCKSNPNLNPFLAVLDDQFKGITGHDIVKRAHYIYDYVASFFKQTGTEGEWVDRYLADLSQSIAQVESYFNRYMKNPHESYTKAFLEECTQSPYPLYPDSSELNEATLALGAALADVGFMQAIWQNRMHAGELVFVVGNYHARTINLFLSNMKQLGFACYHKGGELYNSRSKGISGDELYSFLAMQTNAIAEKPAQHAFNKTKEELKKIMPGILHPTRKSNPHNTKELIDSIRSRLKQPLIAGKKIATVIGGVLLGTTAFIAGMASLKIFEQLNNN